MGMLQFLKFRLPHPSCPWKQGISSSQARTNRTYFKPWPRRCSNTCSPKRQASSTPASGAAERLLVHSGIVPVLQGYAKIQAQRPYTTQICTSIVIWLCGDLSAQLLFPPEPIDGENDGDGSFDKSQNLQEYDPWRTARHLTVGIVASIPSYEWFMFLHRRFNFASRVASLATKVLVQQAVYTPVFNTYFFTMHSLLSGASVEQTLIRLKLALPTSIVNGWKVWTGVAIVSFMYIPPQFRSVLSGCVAVVWQSYLSWTNRNVERKVDRRTRDTQPGGAKL